jgi:hypothetical protein
VAGDPGEGPKGEPASYKPVRGHVWVRLVECLHLRAGTYSGILQSYLSTGNFERLVRLQGPGLWRPSMQHNLGARTPCTKNMMIWRFSRLTSVRLCPAEPFVAIRALSCHQKLTNATMPGIRTCNCWCECTQTVSGTSPYCEWCDEHCQADSNSIRPNRNTSHFRQHCAKSSDKAIHKVLPKKKLRTSSVSLIVLALLKTSLGPLT